MQGISFWVGSKLTRRQVQKLSAAWYWIKTTFHLNLRWSLVSAIGAHIEYMRACSR